MGTDVIAARRALQSLAPKTSVTCEFACDNDVNCKKFLTSNFPCKRFFDNCLTSEFINEAPPVDVFCCGFPCQPWSQEGLQQGGKDTRASPMHIIVKMMTKQSPLVCILENVMGILSKRHSKVRRCSLEVQIMCCVVPPRGFVDVHVRRAVYCAASFHRRTLAPF